MSPERAAGAAEPRSHLDTVAHGCISGWAWDGEGRDEPVVVIVTIDDRVLARVLADQHRGDLAAAGIGDGRHGFELMLDPPLDDAVAHLVSVRREGDGTHLEGSPRDLPGTAVLGEVERASFSAVLASTCDDAELDARLAFLSDQVDLLRQRRVAGRAAARAGAAPRRRALVIDDAPPRPGHDAGSNAILSHMLSLQRLGFEVSFAAADMALGPDFKDVGIEWCARPWFGSVEEVVRRQVGRFDLVYMHRVTNASRYMSLVREQQPRARLVYSVADLHHLRLARQAEVEGRPELARYGLHVRHEELTVAARADAVITHSSVEAALLRAAVPRAVVHVVPWTVPLRPTSVSFAERRGLAFIAHYGHKPNVDAAQWLVEAVLPALVRLGSAMPCLLVGTAMPDAVRRLARDRVEILGPVADLGAVFDRVRLTAAPLAYGAGLKGKVLDSLASGVPCVCTPVAAEGFSLPAPLDAQVAATAEIFAASALRLHEDPALNASCRAVGLTFVEAFASEDNVDGLMREVVGAAGRF